MGKLTQFLATTGVVAMPFLVPVPVMAEANCTIENTGPGSENVCEVERDFTCRVENNTVVIVDNNNNQVATSGTGTTSGNTGGGGATSGSATNSNGTTFNFEITNGNQCVVTSSEPKPTSKPKPTKQPVPAPTGQGQGQGQGRGQVQAPAVLADTSAGDWQAAVAALGLAGLAGIGLPRAYAAFKRR